VIVEVYIMKAALAILCLIFICSTSVHAKLEYPLGTPGSVANYELTEDIGNRPEFERTNNLSVVKVSFTIGQLVKIGNIQYQWFNINFSRKNGETHSAWLLIDTFPSKTQIPNVAKYLWYEDGWPDALDFVNAVTGKAELPRLSLWKYGWPRDINDTAPVAITNDKSAQLNILFQGYIFKLANISATKILRPGKVTTIRLRPDTLVGLAGTDKDQLGRHKASFGPDFRYSYDAPPSRADVQADLDSGLNFFANHNKADKWLYRTSCYISNMYGDFDDWPLDLYRSNFYGRAWMVDEPCVHYRGTLAEKPELAGKLTPTEAAKGLEEFSKARYNEHDGHYGRDSIAMVVGKYFGIGKMKLVDYPYPIWEVWWDTSWYQIADSDTPCGIIDEDIYPEDMIEKLNMAFDTRIPPLLENACEIRIAFGRGAARNFNKEWGTALYGYFMPAINPKLDMASYKYMYDAGASYFFHWYGWVGATDAQIPFSYKRFYANAMCKYINMNPKRDMNKLLYAASKCIVLPYGYAFSPEPMFRIRWMSLDRKNLFGITYRQVLANAAAEMENLLHNGTKFDVAIDEPRFTAKGYKELIYIRENGRVDVVRNGNIISSYQGPVKTPYRADYGPGPKVYTETKVDKTVNPAKISIKISTEPGTGEIAKSLYIQQPPLVWTDVLLPDLDCIYTGAAEFDIPAKPGTYKIRATTSDCFGRPAIVEKEVVVD